MPVDRIVEKPIFKRQVFQRKHERIITREHPIFETRVVERPYEFKKIVEVPKEEHTENYTDFHVERVEYVPDIQPVIRDKVHVAERIVERENIVPREQIVDFYYDNLKDEGRIQPQVVYNPVEVERIVEEPVINDLKREKPIEVVRVEIVEEPEYITQIIQVPKVVVEYVDIPVEVVNTVQVPDIRTEERVFEIPLEMPKVYEEERKR